MVQEPVETDPLHLPEPNIEIQALIGREVHNYQKFTIK